MLHIGNSGNAGSARSVLLFILIAVVILTIVPIIVAIIRKNRKKGIVLILSLIQVILMVTMMFQTKIVAGIIILCAALGFWLLALVKAINERLGVKKALIIFVIAEVVFAATILIISWANSAGRTGGQSASNSSSAGITTNADDSDIPEELSSLDKPASIISDADYAKLLEGSDPSLADSMSIMPKKDIVMGDQILFNLINGQMWFRSVKPMMGEGIDLGNGYKSFKDGSVLMAIDGGYKVRNIVYTDKYTNDICMSLHVGSSLEEVERTLGTPGVGSVAEGWLGYRTRDVYIFFYENEISVYGYTYYEDESFDEYLNDYIASGNLEEFGSKVSYHRIKEDIGEYDRRNQYLRLRYPSHGVDIYIKNNNPKGIIIYSNCYLTDTIRNLAREGKITLKADEDLIVIKELERRGVNSSVKISSGTVPAVTDAPAVSTPAPAVSNEEPAQLLPDTDGDGYAEFQGSFTLEYPASFNIISSDANGFVCTSPDGAGTITAERIQSPASVQSAMQSYISQTGGSIDYQSSGDKYYAVRLLNGSQYNYRYSRYDSGNAYAFSVVFPASQFGEYDTIINDMYQSMVSQFN